MFMTLKQYLNSKISELSAELKVYQFESSSYEVRLYREGLQERIADLENQLFELGM